MLIVNYSRCGVSVPKIATLSRDLAIARIRCKLQDKLLLCPPLEEPLRCVSMSPSSERHDPL